MRLMLAVFAAALIGYVYVVIASVGSAYLIAREWNTAEAIAQSQRSLEAQYAATLEEVRTGGAALGLVASGKPRFVESFSLVAKADRW